MPTTVLRDTTNKVVYSSSSTNTQTISLTTSGINRLAILQIFNRFGTASVSTVVSSGLVWTRRNNTFSGVEIWTAIVPAQQTTSTVTVTFSTTNTNFILILDTYNLSGNTFVPTIDNIQSDLVSVSTQLFTNTIQSKQPFTTVVSYLFAVDVTGSLAVVTAGSNFTLTNSQQIGNGPSYLCASEISNTDIINQGNTLSPVFNVAQNSTGILITFTLSANPQTPSPPTGVTAVYTGPSAGNAGFITVSWTAPIDYVGLGFNVYRISDNSLLTSNGIPRKHTIIQVSWGTLSFVDNELPFPPSRSYTYYIATIGQGTPSGVIGNTLIEGLLSIGSTPVTYLG